MKTNSRIQRGQLNTREECKGSLDTASESDKTHGKDMKTADIDDNLKSPLSYLPIYIGSAISAVIFLIGICFSYIIIKHPDSKMANCLGRFV